MRKLRVLLTGAMITAVGGAAAVVVTVAAAQPRSAADESLPPLPLALATPSSEPGPSPTAQTARLPAPTAPPHPAAAPPTTSRRTPPAVTRTSHPAAPPPRVRPPARVTPAAKPPPKPVPVRGQALPLAYSTANASRVVTVVAAATWSTTATVQAWDRAPGGGWLRHGPAVAAHVGAQGLTTQPSESLSATPIGSFSLTQAFGRLSNPGTGLPYFQVGWSDWWVSDANSGLYNTHQRCTACPFNTAVSENLYGAGSVYDYAVVIDYNRPAAGWARGSAFFLHVTDGSATAGCVAIPRASLVSIMRWLAPGAAPRILIGVA